MCNTFIAYAKKDGWKVFPETSGWDLLLVKDIQIGIQAKLKDNIEVLAQTIPSPYDKIGPNIRAILVPHASKEFRAVANALNIFVIEGSICSTDVLRRKYWRKEIKTDINKYNKKYITHPAKLCWVPDIEIDVPAGVKSPKSITEWKIKAIKLCFELNKKGYLTSKDFQKYKLSITIWKIKWLIDSGKKDGKLIKYVKNPNATLPDELYPEITAAISRNC